MAKEWRDSQTGPIPADWAVVQCKQLGTVGRPAVKAGPFGSSLKKEIFVSEGFKVYGQEQVVAGNASIGNYYIDKTTYDNLRSCDVRPGDILVSLVGTIGQVLVVPQDAEPGIINPRLLRLSLDAKRVDADFARCWLQSPYIATLMRRQSQGGTMGILNAGLVGAMPMVLPSLFEQRKIAEILRTWDEAIATVEQLIAALQRRKKGLMERLLTGQLRFPEFEDAEWEEVELGQFLSHTPRKVPKPSETYKRMGVRSHGKGTFTEIVEDPGSNAMDHLYEVKGNDLMVNITFAWEQAIAIVSPDDEGSLVSHRFPTYEFNRSKVVPEFFRYLMLTKRFLYQLDLITPGGAGRNRVMSKTDFLKLQVTIPPVEEQKRIGAVLSLADKEINAFQEYLRCLKEQKKGLMQRLLTGQVRVQTDDEQSPSPVGIIR